MILWFSWGIILTAARAQDATLTGLVRDKFTGQAIDLVTVYVDGLNRFTETDSTGVFDLSVPAQSSVKIIFRRLGYYEQTLLLREVGVGRIYRATVELEPETGVEVEVRARVIEQAAAILETVEELKKIPSASGNFESILPSIALGTSSGSGGELTSQYNVRGGNYDENLVYVNDFEIYRPQLIRAGQQEGLSFPNIDLIKDLQFSSGGFEAKYGDKLSSVLDIRYKRPEEAHYSVGMSLLGAHAHLEGSAAIHKDSYRKFRYLLGARYKTTQYLLGSLQVTGEYTPNFMDVQGYFTYDLNRDWQIGWLTNLNRSVYQFIPEARSTATGLIDFALRLSADFSGQERDRFTTGFNGLALTYIPDRDRNPLYLKFLASHQFSQELESFDIQGAYRLSVIETDFGSEEAGEDVLTIGDGIQHQYVRNFLIANVAALEHKGGIEYGGSQQSHFLQWGLKAQSEDIYDRIHEWERLDSAGYSLPYNPEQVTVRYLLNTQNELESYRFSGFIQDTWSKSSPGYESKLTYGLRWQYWNLNREFSFTPRVQWLYQPLRRKDISYRLAAGMYYQPPFYRELRNTQGLVSENVLAQKSAHVVAGWTWDFSLGPQYVKPFRLISEVYYKYLWDLVTYDIENVRIRYAGVNDGKGYAIGWDTRLNGEFVKGAESWINLSLLRTREKIEGLTHLTRKVGEKTGTPVADVPRPTDQLVQLSLFFQDYLPKNENFKVHVNFTVGTGLPYGLANNNRIYRNTYRYPPYHRLDIGFSYQFWDKSWLTKKPHHWLRFTDNAWMSVEVFNLMKILNVASNTWIKSIYNVQYAIPNYLTTRRINVRLRVDF